MSECKPVSMPMETGKRFDKLDDNGDPVNIRGYQAAIGSLVYASIATRPDLSSSVGAFSQFMSNPDKEHWSGVERVLRYIKRTIYYGIKFEASNHDQIELCGYTDAGLAGDVVTRKSTSGYVFYIGKSTISWRSNRQSIIVLSSTEAEYISLSAGAQEATWLRRLLCSVGFKQETPTTIYEDNQGTIALTKNPKSHSRTKHIDIKYHFIREAVENKVVKLVYCGTEKMFADILTKGLPKPKFEELRLMLGVTMVH